MNLAEATWLDPLRRLLKDVREPEPGREGLEKLIAALAEVEAILALNRAQMPSELVHFLEKRSYEKAAQYCEGHSGIPRGTCGARG